MILSVKLYRKKWAIFAEKSRLSCLFPSESAALNELEKNYSFYDYWAKSAGVKIENTPPTIKKIQI